MQPIGSVSGVDEFVTRTFQFAGERREHLRKRTYANVAAHCARSPSWSLALQRARGQPLHNAVYHLLGRLVIR
jgi:hypothetical protein